MAGEKKKKTEQVASKTLKTPAKKAAQTPGAKAPSTKVPSTKAPGTKAPAAKASDTKAPGKKEAAKRPAPKADSLKGGRKPSKSTVQKQTPPPGSAPKIVVDWPVFIEKMEKFLLANKAELVETLIANNKDFKEIVEGMDPKDFADIASDDIDRKMIEALGAQELKRLRQIDSALTRIKQGKYCLCIKCDKRIPPDRLEAIPYALMCIGCKSEEERRNR